MAVVAARFYGDPTATLRVAGITGTNGKTTTAFLTRALLEGAGSRRACSGTVKSVVGGVEHAGRAHDARGDRPPAHVPRDARRAATPRARWRSPRTRSSCSRADAIHVAAAVFTNLTQDHLDFHPTMEDYFQAKRLLFASQLTEVRIANADDAYGRRLIEEFACADVRDRRARPTTARSTCARTATGCDFVAVTPDGSFPARVPLPGRFNVLNALAAWAAARALGAPADGPRRVAGGRRDRARALPAGRGRPAVRRRRRLRAQARRAGAGAAGGARAGVRAADRGRRRGRGPRPRQAPDHGRDRGPAGRRRADHLRQPALRGAGGDHRRDRGRHPVVAARGGRARRRPARDDLPRDRAGPARRRRRDRRQGPRAGPGVRGRPQGAVRRLAVAREAIATGTGA